MTEESEYLLTPLRESAGFIYYRGVESAGQTPVLAIAVAADQASQQSMRRLEHEYSLANELGPAWAARPLALTRRQGQLILILDDPGGEPLDRLMLRQGTQPFALDRSLRIAIGLAAAIGQAHRQGLVHKDLKPANVLVDDAGHAWLMGFGIASRVSRERQAPDAPELIAGSLPYMAPEQTGRMNRSIDSRSDLYSLGVTLYEMFTGTLPFTASDPMEWVHCQIAMQPLPPAERSPHVPNAVSSIILKLLTKTAEDRYQTAAGVERDLQHCLLEWESKGHIAPFMLGMEDRPDRLLIPEHLYGREREVAELLASFERVVRGRRPELMLVSGYSGIGKSSVVHELHKALVPPRGVFASGKFDQYKRDIPYATLSQALQSLVRPLLAKDEQEVSQWREAMLEALGPHAQLMVDLVPDLRLIIGEQPALPELSPQDAQNRFQLVFRRFIGALTGSHPLALFLDDLQWLDAATLDLMESLLTHPDVKDLLLIGAYRDNEVDATHPLLRKRQAMIDNGATVCDIVIAPLKLNDVERLVADSFHCGIEYAKPFAALIDEKTGGNPFFSIQFMGALFDQNLLVFDHAKGRWTWDADAIRGKGYTDNIVDLMINKLSRLPEPTRLAMQQLACLGNTANVAILQIVCEETAGALHDKLWEAVKAGLILRAGNAYRFLHDRVQEAAYLLIPEERRAESHLRIGRLMFSHTTQEDLPDEIFEIVNQINRGLHLIQDYECCKKVASLNLMAGSRSKASTAYSSALKYLYAGRFLLRDSAWRDDYGLILSLELIAAECELHTADMVSAENRLTLLASRAQGDHELAAIARLRITLYTAISRSEQAIDVFLGYLRRHGTAWPKHPSREDVAHEYGLLLAQLGSRQIEELIDLPRLDDARVLDMLDVFTEIVHPAMFFDENLSTLVVCRMVALCLENGNCDASSFGYVWLGMFIGPRFNHYDEGFRFGQLGYDLVEKKGLLRYQARTYLSFANLLPWARHAAKARELIRRAFEVAHRTGDLTFFAYSWHSLITNYLAVGDPLPEVQAEVEKGLSFVRRAGFDLVIENAGAQLGLIRTLRGLTSTFGNFDAGDYSEADTEHRLARNPSLALAEFFYWTRKLQARYFAADYPAAVDASRRAHRLLWPAASQFETGDFRFFAALAHAGACISGQVETIEEHLSSLHDHYRQLQVWATHCPANFQAKSALVGAEIARIEGRLVDAEHSYELSILSAKENGFPHYEAVACECAARFYSGRGLLRIAKLYWREARACFLSWGAIGKVHQLEACYSHLRDRQRDDRTLAFDFATSPLDVDSFIKASQAISGEIVLPRLIERLVTIAMENAGADRGLLILCGDESRSDAPTVRAEGSIGHGRIEVAIRQSKATPADLPYTLLHYVVRTKQRVLLDDVCADETYSKDAYVLQHRPRSVLCLPIVKQAKLVGALYLENHLATDAFTPNSVAVLELLASQAAISLENAQLYADLHRSEAFLVLGQRISHTGTFGWSQDAGEFYWSDENYRMLAYDKSVQASPHLALQRLHPDDREHARSSLEAAMKYNRDIDSEQRWLMPDGSIKHIRVIGRAVTTGGIDYVGAVRDVTAQVQAEETLRQAQAELAYVARVATLNTIAASIGHEVSQPLSGILTNGHTCLRMLDADPIDLAGATDAVRRAIRDALRAKDVITRLRALFSKRPSRREAIDLNDAAQEVIALSARELKKRRAILVVDLAADVPFVCADRVQLQQVILNLLLNGADAMADVDGRARTLKIATALDDDGDARLSVTDAGVGIDPRTAEKLFEAFYTTKEDGMGVGLAVCRSIIESHEGRIWGENNDGPGSTFSFSVPPCQA